MVYLPPNKSSLIGRCVVLLLFLFIGYCVVGNAIMAPDKYPLNNMTWMWTILLLLVIILTASSFTGVVKLEEDAASKQIIVSTLFKKKAFAIREIDGYYMSVYKSSKSNVTRYGRTLMMKDGKRLELYPGNLTYIDSIDQLMTDNSIPYLGEKSMSFPFSTMFNSAV